MRRLVVIAQLLALRSLDVGAQAPASPIARSEFLFVSAPFRSVHASTIVETRSGLLVAFFGGTHEAEADVEIWLSRVLLSGAWTPPRSVATGAQPNGTRYPCWNPVLFQSRDGTLFLFYKVGPSPAEWWGMVRSSHDDGETWDEARRLPDGVIGPVKNKPVQLADGTIVSGSSTESAIAPRTWRVHFELSSDGGKTWSIVKPGAAAPGSEIDAIQPSILVHPRGRLEAVGRTQSGRLFETWSDDGGKSWQPLSLGTLPNPNSGTDAVTLRDGRHLIVYNHTTQGRTPLNVAISDDGKVWKPVAALESDPGEYSYPAVIQSRDGLVHVTYTWKRQRIKHVVLDLIRG